MKKLLVISIIASTEVMGAGGVCIVCPPGYDCSSGTPIMGGSAGQVLIRTAGGTAWTIPEASTGVPAALGTTGAAGVSTNYARGDHIHQLPTAAEIGAVPNTRTINNKALSGNITLSASDVDVVPTARTIAGFNLSEDITVAELKDVLDSCNLPAAGTAGSGTVEWGCNSSNSDPPASAGGTNYETDCWCRFRKASTKALSGASCTVYSSWVYLSYIDYRYGCESHCGNSCSGNMNWPAASVF